MNKTRNVSQYWLLLGTMYGPMIGHAIGKVVVGARRKFRDDTMDVFWYSVYGLLIGLALAVIAEVLSRSKRHATYGLNRIYSVLWWFLPVAVILYVTIVPAITVAR